MIIKSGLNLSQWCACVPSVCEQTAHVAHAKSDQIVPDIPQEHFEHVSHQLQQSLLQPVHPVFVDVIVLSTRWTRTPKHLVPAPWHGTQCYSPRRGGNSRRWTRGISEIKCHRYITQFYYVSNPRKRYLVGGFFQPLWKICSSNWIISPGFGMKRKKYQTTNQIRMVLVPTWILNFMLGNHSRWY